MEAYVHQASFAYSDRDDLLVNLRQRVQELKSHHPELVGCSLADVSFTRRADMVDVTLYFQAKADGTPF